MPRLRALLSTARIANLPGVVSNVMLGMMLGAWHWGFGPNSLDPADLLLLAASGICLYLAGTFANDWHDRRWDRDHRPDRALPAGHFKPTTFAATAAAMAVAGLACAALASPAAAVAAAVLLAMVATYTWLHKRSAWAVLPMGLCRACLYFLGFVHLQSTAASIDLDTLRCTMPRGPAGIDLILYDRLRSLAFIATHALGLLSWIAGISLVARHESTAAPGSARRWLAGTLLFVPLAAMSCWWVPFYPLAGALGLLPLAAWLAVSLRHFAHPLHRRVSALLAGTPLVDFIAALPLALSLATPGATLTTHPWLLATIATPPAAFLLGLLLQKLAPAT